MVPIWLFCRLNDAITRECANGVSNKQIAQKLALLQ